VYRIARVIAADFTRGRESWPPSTADVAAFVPPAPLACEATV
jgi:hypothetical protein